MQPSLQQARFVALLLCVVLVAGIVTLHASTTSRGSKGGKTEKVRTLGDTPSSSTTTPSGAAGSGTSASSSSTVGSTSGSTGSTQPTSTTSPRTAPPPSTTAPAPPPAPSESEPSPPPSPSSPAPPASTGWPGPTNTGVPAGVVLTPSRGMTIRTPGTVIDGLDVDGCIMVRASNVTIKNTRVRQNGECWTGAIDTDFGGYSNILIQDVEVDGRRMNGGGAIIGAAGFTCIRCNLHDGGHGVHMAKDIVIVDSWVHDLWGSGSAHNDGVLSNGGSHFVIRHNTLVCDVGFPGNDSPGGGCSGAVALFGDFGQVDDVLVDNNWLVGGAYCVFAGSGYNKPYPNSTNIRFINNQFGRQSPSWNQCGIYGPYTGWANNAGNVWSGNTWADNGQPIS